MGKVSRRKRISADFSGCDSWVSHPTPEEEVFLKKQGFVQVDANVWVSMPIYFDGDGYEISASEFARQLRNR
jgi:hypothetical protein